MFKGYPTPLNHERKAIGSAVALKSWHEDHITTGDVTHTQKKT